ncbi:MAG: outer membrane protein [Pseudolabrys sp.]
MKKLLLASAGILALGVASAPAADIQRRVLPAQAPVYVAPVYNWTGFYVGVNGGGGWGRSDFDGPFATGSFDLHGGFVGPTLGYNWQSGSLVYGIEGDIDWTNLRGDAPCGVTLCETRNHWLGTVRGRLGYNAGRFMPYVTGGLAVGDVSTNIAGIGSGRSTEAGYAIGGGVEAALFANWTAKVEYLYVDLGSGGGVAGSNANFHANLVRGGLNYRF